MRILFQDTQGKSSSGKRDKRHTGFSVHSRVRAKTKRETERVGKYMIRPVLARERLSFLEPEGKVGYRYGQDRAEQEMMDYLEFIARVTSHIPDNVRPCVRVGYFLDSKGGHNAASPFFPPSYSMS